ncbi:MAG: hypothetical protein FJY86_01525 [Candidatus Diapherotrites archaeon]|uniref:Phosphatidate cytidylyltransferase n=1 Tax=Candidatus Iainarchaeum sp. TaxID=3101447 RepID=A0A8T4CA47_9ARCH|nr:hypothetical protein [Candidatus Diapherotrites archaeon]
MRAQLGKKSLPWKNELVRQSFHLVFGFFLSGVLFFSSLDFFRIFLIGLFFLGLVLVHVARSRVFAPLNELLSHVERGHERVPGQSVFLFLLGAFVPSIIFVDSFPVFLGLFALTWQDGFSTLVGVRFGRTRILPGKTLEGSLGGFVACVLGLSLVVSLPVAIFLSLIATFAELLPVDDSLSIPFVVSLASLFVL